MATNVPPAPQLSGNAVLEVFVHHSVSAQGARFRMLGERQLRLAYISAVVAKYNLSGNQLTPYVDTHYPGFVAHWVDVYGWRTRMRAVPQDVDLYHPVEILTIFATYAGAVTHECRVPGESGDPVLFEWIRELVFISD